MSKKLSPSEILQELQNIASDESGDKSTEDITGDDGDVATSSSDEDYIHNISDYESSDSDSSIYSDQSDRQSRVNVQLGRDGTEWKEITSQDTGGRLQAQNILRQQAGPTNFAKRQIKSASATTAWNLLINEPILKHIQKCTNMEAERRGQPDWDVSLSELEAFISLLYARGVIGARNLPLKAMWSKQWGTSFFSETFSRDRFLKILRYLRFDARSTRSARLKEDKFALMSETWNLFVKNAQKCYFPGAYVTVDEQLFPTKARCRFTQYMANKPDKFGIKFWRMLIPNTC